MNIIKGRKLSYDYFRVDEDGKEEEAVRAVDRVDLDVKEGDFVAILGHNGSGKSTLAKHINAILLPTEGTLYVDGKIRRMNRSSGRFVRAPAWYFRIRTIRL